MTLRAVFVPLLAMVLTACASGTRAPAEIPTWERPGLGGAVRPEMGSPQPGEAAPDFVLPDLSGRRVSLSSLRGSWVLLHFTATWCPFCDTEITYLAALSDRLAPRGVRTVIVDVAESEATWQAYAGTRVGATMIALHDASGAAARRFAPPRAQPSFDDRAQAALDATLIVDPSGAIRLFLLPDSAHFDPTFAAVRAELERMMPPAVVEVRADRTVVAPGGEAEVWITLNVATGYHVMSDRPSSPTYIATHIAIEGSPDITAGDARYPEARLFSLGNRAITTFAGEARVRVPITAGREATQGPRLLRGTVRYQACTETRCLFPVTRELAVTVDVAR